MTPWRGTLSILCAAGVSAVLACSSAPGSSSDTGAADETGATGPGGTTGELGTSVVGGRVEDLLGTPVTELFVTVSDEYCVPDKTSVSGTFEVTRVTDGPKRLITYGDTAASGPYASVVFPIMVDGETQLQAPVITPRLTERHPVDPDATEVQLIETMDGLQLDVEPGALTLAPFAGPEILIAPVPVTEAPPFTPEGVELEAVFVLHPILSTFNPPAPVRFPADPDLTAGTAVIFHALDYDTGALVPVAEGSVDADGSPATAPGEGIPELTWIAVSLAP